MACRLLPPPWRELVCEEPAQNRPRVLPNRSNIRQTGAKVAGGPANWRVQMDRRSFLKSVAGAGSLAAVGSFPAPAISQGAAAKALRFVPQANLANFDPI